MLLEEEEVHHAAVLAEKYRRKKGGVELPSAPLNKRKVLIIEDDNDVREFFERRSGTIFLKLWPRRMVRLDWNVHVRMMLI